MKKYVCSSLKLYINQQDKHISNMQGKINNERMRKLETEYKSVTNLNTKALHPRNENVGSEKPPHSLAAINRELSAMKIFIDLMIVGAVVTRKRRHVHRRIVTTDAVVQTDATGVRGMNRRTIRLSRLSVIDPSLLLRRRSRCDDVLLYNEWFHIVTEENMYQINRRSFE